jgi:hypothetical protein
MAASIPLTVPATLPGGETLEVAVTGPVKDRTERCGSIVAVYSPL